MRDWVYIVCDSAGARRMTKRTPSLYMGEVAFRLKITIPDEHFCPNMPSLECEVPAGYIVEPEPDIEVVEPPEEEPTQ